MDRVFADWEVWMKTDKGDTLKTVVSDRSDAIEALRAAADKFQIKEESIRETRVTFKQRS